MRSARIALIGLMSAVVLMATTPAFAKGAYEVTLSGGGQEITFAGNGEPHTNTTLSNLAGGVGLYDGMWSEAKWIDPPTGDLGPRITAVWQFIGPAGDIPIVQHIYLAAAGGPVVHIPPGQVFIDEPVVEAWVPTGPRVIDELAAVGFDLGPFGLKSEVSVVSTTVPAPPVAQPVAVAVSQELPPSSANPIWSVILVAGLAAATALGLASGIMRRRNQQTV